MDIFARSSREWKLHANAKETCDRDMRICARIKLVSANLSDVSYHSGCICVAIFFFNFWRSKHGKRARNNGQNGPNNSDVRMFIQKCGSQRLHIGHTQTRPSSIRRHQTESNSCSAGLCLSLSGLLLWGGREGRRGGAVRGGGGGLKRSGVDPPLSSSRACHLHCQLSSLIVRVTWTVRCSSCPSPSPWMGKELGCLYRVLGFVAFSD